MFAHAHVQDMPVHVSASAIDVQSFLRWYGQTAASPSALLVHLHHEINTRVPEADAPSIHMGVMNATLEVAHADMRMDPVQSELYMNKWSVPEAATIGTYFIDDPGRLAQWPFPDPDLRMVHFDWTTFAWQWRLLVTRSVSDLFPRYGIYNGLDDRVLALARSYRTQFMPTKEREICLAIDADGQASGTTPDQGIQHNWRGILSALHTLFRHKGDAVSSVTYFLHTCAPDGLWLAVVSVLMAHDQGVPISSCICQWRDQAPIDAALVADGMTRYFKKAPIALAACLLFWVDTQCTDTWAYRDLFARLNQGTIRPSKGADFSLSLACLTYARMDHILETTTTVLSTCEALCRAAWQRNYTTSHAKHRPEHIVYARVFWEAWGVSTCPVFGPSIAQCISWMNFTYACLVNNTLKAHVVSPTSTSSDTLFYGLASRVDGTRPPLRKYS